MPVRCKLGKLLHSRNELQSQFADRVGLARQTIQKLCSNQLSAIDLATLEKVCRGLEIPIGELMVIEETKLEQRLRQVSDAVIVLGAPKFQDPDRPHQFICGIDPMDMESASHISEQMSHLAPSGCRVRLHSLPARDQWNTGLGRDTQQRDTLNWEEQAETLLKTTKGVLFIVGNDLVNGFTHYCLDTILDVGYDPRGRTRRPRRMEIPYRILYRSSGAVNRRLKQMILAGQSEGQISEGIWETHKRRMVAERDNSVPTQGTFSQQNTPMGAVIYVDEPSFHHPHCLVVGIAGSTSTDTAIVVEHLFGEQNLQLLDLQLCRTEPFSSPVFAVACIELTEAGVKVTLTS